MSKISIEFVINHDLPKFKRAKAAVGFNITCPFCKGKYKFNVNPKGFARCAKCGDGEDPTKGFDSIKLHSKLTGLSRKDAENDLNKLWQGMPSDAQIKYQQVDDENTSKLILPSEARGDFYNVLLFMLKLDEKHKNDLISRGLDEDFIEQKGYKSLWKKNTKQLTKKIVSNLRNDTKGVIQEYRNKSNNNYGVPGFINLFTKDQDAITYENKDGFLIPVVDENQNISGLQIRFDKLSSTASQEEKDKYRKYTWLSSSHTEGGIDVHQIKNIHHTGFVEFKKEFKKYPEYVYLTEGCLKADIASHLSKRPFISLMGVNNISQLKDELKCQKTRGCKTIMICIDMDYRDKKEVKQALKKIISTIRQSGLHAQLGNWPSEYKGIDDFLVARKRGETKDKIHFVSMF